jgi:hypothetical protein
VRRHEDLRLLPGKNVAAEHRFGDRSGLMVRDREGQRGARVPQPDLDGIDLCQCETWPSSSRNWIALAEGRSSVFASARQVWAYQPPSGCGASPSRAMIRTASPGSLTRFIMLVRSPPKRACAQDGALIVRWQRMGESPATPGRILRPFPQGRRIRLPSAMRRPSVRYTEYPKFRFRRRAPRRYSGAGTDGAAREPPRIEEEAEKWLVLG